MTDRELLDLAAKAAGIELSDWSTSENGDPYAATRRAIVRAAAEIGKTMGEQA